MAVTVNFNGSTYSVPSDAGESGWESTLTQYLTALAAGAAVTSTMKQTCRVATTSPVTVQAATDFTVVCKLSSPGAVTVNLPAGATGRLFAIVDGTGDAGTNNITIDGNGAETINGQATYVINENFGGVLLHWNGTEWSILADFVGNDPRFSSINVSGTATVGTLTATNATVGGVAVVTTSASQTLSNKSIDADANTITNIDNADIKAGAAIARSKLASGSNNHVLINDGSGVMSSEAQLATSRGGTGVNSSATFPSSGTVATVPSSGVVKSNGSVLSASNVSLTTEVTGVLPTANGGTGQNSTATFPTSGTVVTREANETLSGNKTFSGTVTVNDVSGTNAVRNGGNTTAAAMSIGTNGAQDLNLRVNGVTSMTLTAAGAVGLGTDPDVVIPGLYGVTLPSGNDANRPSAAANGTIRYNTTSNAFEGRSNGAWQAIGGGVNELPLKNYLKTYATAAVAPGTLSTTGDGVAVTPGNIATTAGLFYADATSGSAALTQSPDTTLRGAFNYLTAISGADTAGSRFVQFPAFALEGSDAGKPVSISFDVAPGTPGSGHADNDWDVVVARYNSAGTFQGLIPVAGNASTVTNTPSAKLPTGTAQFRGFFVANSSTSDLYALRFRRRSGSAQVRLDTLYVGPQAQLAGAAVTDWQSYTPTWTSSGTQPAIGNGAISGRWRRVGDQAEIQIALFAGSTTTYGTGVYSFSFPSGLSADTTKLVDTTFTPMGTAEFFDSGVNYRVGVVNLNSATQISAMFDSAIGNIGPTTPATWSNGDGFSLHAFIPIANWSSNVTMAERAVEEYASFDGSGVQGPSGALVPNTAFGTGDTTLNVTFSSPIQATDRLTIEYQSAGAGPWMQATELFPYFQGNNASSINRYGIQGERNGSDFRVNFGNRGIRVSASNVDNGAAAWSTQRAAGDRWRVRKVSGGAAVGFPVGARNVVGDTTGTAVPSSMLGERLTQALTTNFNTDVTAGNFTDSVQSLTLTPGVWNLRFRGGTTMVSGASAGTLDFRLEVQITDSSNNVVARTVIGARFTGASQAQYQSVEFGDVVVPATSTAYKVRIRANQNNNATGVASTFEANGTVLSGAVTNETRLYAVRIA